MTEPAALDVLLRQQEPVPLDVAFTCRAGEVTALFGPSGGGKTTILRCIAGLARPAAGRVTCGGDAWLDTAIGLEVPTHRRAVGYVVQEYALFPHLTALGNVAAAMGHRPASQRDGEARRLLGLVHLDGLEERRPLELSGGQRQRVAMARALAREPRVLLLDEPFAALDRRVRHTLQQELADLRQDVSLPIVLVTHDFDDVVRLATSVVVIDAGRVIASGPIEDVTSRADLPQLAGFFDPGAVFDATVLEVDEARGLMRLTFAGGVLLAPSRPLAAGTRLRVRIHAREVALATRRPERISLHNILEGRVSAIEAARAEPLGTVQVQVGAARLLARVTRDAIQQLGLLPGAAVFALVKSVAIES